LSLADAGAVGSLAFQRISISGCGFGRFACSIPEFTAIFLELHISGAVRTFSANCVGYDMMLSWSGALRNRATT
jgi:hypothetical protein